MNKLGRALVEFDDPPIKALFVYNCNPVATMPDQQRVLQGMAREDLFTVVFDQVMTDTAVFADVILPATTFLEAYDFARGYGPLSLQLVGRSSMPSANRDRTPKCSASWPGGSICSAPAEPDNELEMLLQLFKTLPGTVGAQMEETGRAVPPFGFRPIQFVDVMPRTPDAEGRSVSGSARGRSAAGSVHVPARSGDRPFSARADLARRATRRSARRSASCRGRPSRC